MDNTGSVCFLTDSIGSLKKEQSCSTPAWEILQVCQRLNFGTDLIFLKDLRVETSMGILGPTVCLTVAHWVLGFWGMS